MSPSALFKAPVYIPSEYNFSGLQFDELPHLAKHYLANEIGITSPSDATSEELVNRYIELASKLVRCLEGNDRALVELKTDARRKSIIAPHEPEMTTYGRDMARVKQVLEVLLPERQSILDDFVVKWDALIWLEMEGLDERTRLTVEQQKQHRHNTLIPVLERSQESPVELDEHVLLLEMRVRDNRHILPPKRNSLPKADTFGNFRFPAPLSCEA
ncbi:unnamed protein product [Somion occarium]|uniref:Uncharacterized protein n=1 Tax=Somion occarium TaxID=3059160 RepID=A0ABP1DHK5_9APHY